MSHLFSGPPARFEGPEDRAWLALSSVGMLLSMALLPLLAPRLERKQVGKIACGWALDFWRKPQSHSVPLEALRVPAKQRKHEKKPRDIGKGYGPSLLKPAACGPRLLHDARDRNPGGRPEPNHRAAEPNGVS